MSTIPFVTCYNCGREAMCVRTKDGTVYRPAAWTFEGPDVLRGLCGECQTLDISEGKRPDWMTR